MTAHARITPPEGHGEVLCQPPYDEWPSIAALNGATVRGYPAGLQNLRTLARAEACAAATVYSRSIGLNVAAFDPLAPIVMSGHQPELSHPGVWVKYFLLDRIARDNAWTGLNLVVDTDRAEGTSLTVPVLGPPVGTRDIVLAGAGEGAYVQAGVPDRAARAAFRSEGLAALGELPAPALGHHFQRFCDGLEAAADRASDLADLLTATRRSYEAPAGSAYLELPVSVMSRSDAFQRFAVGIMADATRFRQVMNAALRSYRERTGTRPGHPFPDLEERSGFVESPFWLLREGRRERVWAGADGSLRAGEHAETVAGRLVGGVLEDLGRDVVLAPRALTLTMFARVFVADLFIHGIGGGRYDRVTDAIIRAYYGVEPPRYVVASMTLLLPLGVHVSSEGEVAGLSHALHRLEHNPDSMLEEVEFDDDAEYHRAHDLAARKAALVTAIATPDADRKSLGSEIRAVNAELARMLAPMAEDLRLRLQRAEAARDAADVLTDRTYPYCLWDPLEVADKVR